MNEGKLSDFVLSKKECENMNVLESIFKTFLSLGGHYHDRLNANKGITFYLNKDEALNSLRKFDQKMFGKKDIELHLNDLNFPIIAIPIIAYDASIPSFEYKDWLFDSDSCREKIKAIATEYRVPIYSTIK